MQNYHYFAFISYQHQDEKWANWLQRKLENYKIPISDNNSKTSKYIRPVFRDKTDLLPSPLTPALKEALRESKYLIVICSTNATKSSYVNEEINYYINLGRKDYIIPFIIDGKPYSENNELECFPDALRLLPKEDEINGCNIQESGKEHAFIATVARMLNLKFDTLWDRFKRRKKRYKLVFYTLLSCFAVCCLGSYEYCHTKVEYYSDYVNIYGVPHGIMKLNTTQVSHKNRCYRFKFKRIPFGEQNALQWRVISLEYVNSFGSIEDPDVEKRRASIIKYEYYKNSGQISQVNFCNRNGKIQYRYKYSSPNINNISSIIDVKKSIEERGEGFIASNSIASEFGQEQYANITRLVLNLHEGFATKMTFHYSNSSDFDKSITADENGVYGKTMKLDSIGRCIEESFIDHNGHIRCDKQGIARIKYKYDEWGNITELSYWNQSDSLKVCSEGWAIQRKEADNYGNIIRVSLFDAQNKPCNHRDLYYSSYKQAYNPKGCITSREFYDTIGAVTTNKQGYSKILFEYDKRGYYSKVSFYGMLESLIMAKNSCAGAFVKCDKHGNTIENIFFDDSGKICKNSDGIAILKQKYDNNGNLIEQSYYDENSRLCMNRFDYAKLINEFDENGRRVKGVYIDTIGNTHISSYYGYAILTNQYDVKGNLICTSYFDESCNPILRKESYASVEYQYNEFGLKTDETRFGLSHKPVPDYYGICRREWLYDTHGNCIKLSYLGINNEAVACKCCGASYEQYKYDDNCNLIEEVKYDINSTPIEKTVYKYDAFGNRISREHVTLQQDKKAKSLLSAILNLVS